MLRWLVATSIRAGSVVGPLARMRTVGDHAAALRPLRRLEHTADLVAEAR
jgi:hypothetical protein